MHDAQTAAGDAVSDETVTAIRTCPLCEAGCGLSIEVTNGSIGRTRGDRLDVFSHGFLCPKGSTLGHLHDDPDRLRQPLVRRDGELVPATWDEAWQAVADGLGRVIDTHGRSALGAYVGNPNAHNLGALLFLLPFLGLAYSLFPWLVLDRITAWDAAAAPESLKIILWGALIVVPTIVGYTVFVYRVFWGKARALTYN